MTTATETHTPSRACHQRGCRAAACEQANYRYQKQLKLEHNRGMRRRCDAAPTRAHIELLTAANWTQRQIAAASGVLAASIHKLYVGAQKDIATWRAAAILAVEVGPPPIADTGRADATGSRRRLQALRVLGYTRYDTAARLGITPDRIKHITGCTTKTVTFEEAAAIARLYKKLSTVAGPSRQTSTIARNKGWYGPLAWDDIDDPKCKPQAGRKSSAKPGAPAKVYADTEQVARLTAAGCTAQQIADEVGCHKRTVHRARRRAEMAVAA
ncbi:helix-turn-helix domain-containing protein [Streptomyces mirabilis]|uniref:helix-turn-helix domain-containing protein n=1 Tax=Streptomyces mirabilis TaxID=68239 RepID=UPI003675BFE9